MLGGAVFGGAPTSDPALNDIITAQNDFLPSAAAQSAEPEMITCNELIPYYDYEEFGGWVENEDRETVLTPLPVTKEKNQYYTNDVLWYQWDVDEDGMCIKIFDQEWLDNRQQYTTPDAIPAPLRVGEYEHYMIYQDPEDQIGTFTYETHAPYVNDFGEWKPHITYNEDDHVKVKFWNTDYVFDKASGAVTTFFMDELQISSDSYVIRAAELGTDDWSNLEINNAPIETTVEMIEGVDEEVLVTFTRTSEEGVYALEHKVYLGVGSPELKTTAKFTNAVYPNHKFAFTETVDLASNIISVNEEEIDLANYVGQSFPREVLEQHRTLIMQIQAIYFNAFLGFDNLWSVNIITPTKVSLDYANVGETQTAIGETHELDPIWGALGSYDPVANAGQCYWGGCGTMASVKHYIYSYNSTWNAQGSCFAQGHYTSGGGNWSPTGPAWFATEQYHAIGMGDNTCADTNIEWDVDDLKGATVQDVWVSHAHNIWSLGGGQMESAWSSLPNTLRMANYPNLGTWGGCADLAACPITHGDLWDTSLGVHWNGNYAQDGVAPNADVYAYQTQIMQHYDFSAQAVTDFNANLQLSDCVNNGDCFFGAKWHPMPFGTKVCTASAAPNCTGGDTDYYSGYTKLGVKFTLPPEDPTGLTAVQTVGGQADLTWLSNWQDAPALDSIGNSGYFISNVAHPYTDFTGGGTQWTGNCGSNPATTPTYGVSGAHGTALAFDGVCDYIGQNSNADLVTPSTNDANGNPTNNYSLNVWIMNDCPTAAYQNGYTTGVTSACAHMPLGSYNTQNFGYMMLNGQWSNYYDDNMLSVNGLYSEEHVVYAWNQAGTSMGGPYTGFTTGKDAGSTHRDQWYMFTMTIDGSKNTKFYVNGNEINLWSYPGACMGGSTFEPSTALHYGFGHGLGVAKTANYGGCSNSVQTAVGSKHGGQMPGMTFGATWHTSGAMTYPMVGKIDEVTTWNKILTQADITALYGGTLPSMSNSTGGTGTHCTWNCNQGYAAYPSVVADWDDHLVNYLPFEESGNPTKNHAVKPGQNPEAETFTIQRDNVTIATGVTDKFYDDAGLTAGNTYVYKVLAVSSTGSSGYSSTASITIAGVPDQVTGLVGTDGATPKIDWTAPNDNGGAITNYKIYRDTALHDTVGNVLTYTDSTSVVIGTTYDYTVSAVNGMGEGPQSAAVAVTAAVPPDAPTSVDATAVPNQINLTWVTPGSDGGSSITGYKIFRTDNLTTPIATVGVVNAWNGDATGTIGVSYTYNVHAINAMGDSPAGVSDTVVHGNVPAQVIVSSVAALLGLAIKVDWGEPAANGYAISSYVVESTVNGGTSWTNIGTPNALTLTHQNLTEASQYQYRVSAVNALGTGTPSAMTTPAVTAGDVPDAPSGHSATQSGVAEIGLAWAEPDDHEYSIDEYRIYRSLTTGGTYTLLVDGLTGLTHTDTSLTVNQAYFYKIQAHNSLGWSADSTIVSATAANVPDQVTGMSSQAIAGSDVVLTWNAAGDNSSVVTNYFIEYSINNATWQTKATVGNVLTYTAQYTPNENGSTYHWRASAINAIGTGAVSASTNTVIGDVPGQVGGLTATAQSATEIDLSWNIPADNGYAITVYKVERSPDNSNWTTLTSNHTITTYDDSGLTASTDYYYKISASNALGIGPSSTAVLEKTFGVPSDITDLALTIVSTTQIDLDWSKPAMNGYAFSNYEIWQSEDGTNYSYIGTITNENTTTISVTGLNINDYYYFYVTTVNAYGTSGDSNIGTAPTLPTPPAATNATAVSDTAINVSWNQPVGDQQTSYKIERSLDDTNWTTLVASTGNTNTTYSDSGLSILTTYYYKVSTINPSGTSVASPSGNAKTFGSPDAPTSLTATALIAIDIDLDWDAPTENNGAAVSGYKIERSTDDINYAVIVADTGNTDTDYTDTDAALVTDTTYYYRVSAINSFGAGATSNVASALAGDKPNQVTGLVITSATTSTLDLDWVAPNDNGYAISGYKIEKSLDGTNFTVLVASNPDLDYTDTSLNTNQIYYYQVSAINVFATGDVSAVSNAPPLPTPPATLSLSVINNVQIDLTWSDPTGAAETGFKIERSTDNTNWSTIVADTGSTALTYSNTGLTALTDYYYRVSTLNASGESSVGSVETAKTFGTTVAPTNLDALSLTGAQIKLDWEEPTVTNGSAVTGYKIERSTDNVSYSVLVADTGNLNETYTDTGIAGTTYYYRVSALNAFGASPPSNVDSALATDVPAQTTNFTATAQAGNEIDLAWTAPSNGGSAITGYQIERSLDNANWSDLVADTGNQLIAYTDINLTTNQTYYYRVSAINLVGTGSSSIVDSDLAGDVPNQITVITATAQAGSEIVVAWTAPTDNAYAITVYTIERSTDNTNWITDGTSATASFTSQSLTNGTTYYYKVTATNALGNSLVSATVNDKAGDSPSQVTGFTGAALDDTRIKLDWTTPADNSYSLSGYKIEQSLDNTNWSTIVANTNSSAVTYTVTGLTTVTDYYYRVSAINALGEGATATVVSVTTMGVPDAITTLAGTAAVNSINTQRSDITLTWTAPTANGTPITAYNVQVSIDGTTWLNLPNVTTTSTIHSNTINDTDFSYRVYSVNAIGTSLVSNTGVVWSLPNVPTGLSADTASLTQINVTWTVMDAAYTYDLEHSTDGNTWSTEADPATTPYNDTGLVTDTIHYYRIAATNPSGTSAFTTSVNATTFHLPTPPQNLTVTPTASNLLEANLDWDAPADDGGTPLLNYTVEKSVDQINWVTLVSNCPPATDCTLSYYVDGALSTQNTYYWRVIAENSFGSDTTNGYSSIVTYTTPTPAQSPSNLTAVPSGTNNNSATLDWVAPVDTGTHGISGYKIERQENNGAWSTLVSTTNSSTTFTDSTLAQSINYGYRVYTLTNNNTMISATTTNTASLEMLDITFTIGVTAIGGSTIAIQPDVLYSDGSHPPTVTQIRVFENSAYETDTTNTPQLLTLNITTGFDIMYAYTPVESTYFAIATLENGGTTQWTSNSVTVTPTAPFTGDLTIQEVREQDLPNAGANWSESELSLEIQPAGSDVIIRYQPEGSVVLSTTTGICIANCPSIVGYASVTQAITHLQDWTWSDSPYTSSQIGLDANKDYYISVYIAPNFTPMSSAAMPNGYPPITVDGDLVQITCTPAQQALGCQPGNIPTGYPSDIAIKSVASPNAPPSLGIDQLGNLFGMPLVFVFVIGLAAVFTSRSAQMGVIIIVACVGIMIYLNYITFDFAEGLNSTNATFALIVIIMVVGFFIGKRYS